MRVSSSSTLPSSSYTGEADGSSPLLDSGTATTNDRVKASPNPDLQHQYQYHQEHPSFPPSPSSSHYEDGTEPDSPETPRMTFLHPDDHHLHSNIKQPPPPLRPRKSSQRTSSGRSNSGSDSGGGGGGQARGGTSARQNGRVGYEAEEGASDPRSGSSVSFSRSPSPPFITTFPSRGKSDTSDYHDQQQDNLATIANGTQAEGMHDYANRAARVPPEMMKSAQAQTPLPTSPHPTTSAAPRRPPTPPPSFIPNQVFINRSPNSILHHHLNNNNNNNGGSDEPMLMNSSPTSRTSSSASFYDDHYSRHQSSSGSLQSQLYSQTGSFPISNLVADKLSPSPARKKKRFSGGSGSLKSRTSGGGGGAEEVRTPRQTQLQHKIHRKRNSASSISTMFSVASSVGGESIYEDAREGVTSDEEYHDDDDEEEDDHDVEDDDGCNNDNLHQARSGTSSHHLINDDSRGMFGSEDISKLSAPTQPMPGDNRQVGEQDLDVGKTPPASFTPYSPSKLSTSQARRLSQQPINVSIPHSAATVTRRHSNVYRSIEAGGGDRFANQAPRSWYPKPFVLTPTRSIVTPPPTGHTVSSPTYAHSRDSSATSAPFSATSRNGSLSRGDAGGEPSRSVSPTEGPRPSSVNSFNAMGFNTGPNRRRSLGYVTSSAAAVATALAGTAVGHQLVENVAPTRSTVGPLHYGTMGGGGGRIRTSSEDTGTTGTTATGSSSRYNLINGESPDSSAGGWSEDADRAHRMGSVSSAGSGGFDGSWGDPRYRATKTHGSVAGAGVAAGGVGGGSTLTPVIEFSHASPVSNSVSFEMRGNSGRSSPLITTSSQMLSAATRGHGSANGELGSPVAMEPPSPPPCLPLPHLPKHEGRNDMLDGDGRFEDSVPNSANTMGSFPPSTTTAYWENASGALGDQCRSSPATSFSSAKEKTAGETAHPPVFFQKIRTNPHSPRSLSPEISTSQQRTPRQETSTFTSPPALPAKQAAYAPIVIKSQQQLQKTSVPSLISKHPNQARPSDTANSAVGAAPGASPQSNAAGSKAVSKQNGGTAMGDDISGLGIWPSRSQQGDPRSTEIAHDRRSEGEEDLDSKARRPSTSTTTTAASGLYTSPLIYYDGSPVSSDGTFSTEGGGRARRRQNREPRDPRASAAEGIDEFMMVLLEMEPPASVVSKRASVAVIPPRYSSYDPSMLTSDEIRRRTSDASETFTRNGMRWSVVSNVASPPPSSLPKNRASWNSKEGRGSASQAGWSSSFSTGGHGHVSSTTPSVTPAAVVAAAAAAAAAKRSDSTGNNGRWFSSFRSKKKIPVSIPPSINQYHQYGPTSTTYLNDSSPEIGPVSRRRTSAFAVLPQSVTKASVSPASSQPRGKAMPPPSSSSNTHQMPIYRIERPSFGSDQLGSFMEETTTPPVTHDVLSSTLGTGGSGANRGHSTSAYGQGLGQFPLEGVRAFSPGLPPVVEMQSFEGFGGGGGSATILPNKHLNGAALDYVNATLQEKKEGNSSIQSGKKGDSTTARWLNKSASDSDTQTVPEISYLSSLRKTGLPIEPPKRHSSLNGVSLPVVIAPLPPKTTTSKKNGRRMF